MNYSLEFEIKALPKLPNTLLRQRWYTVTHEKNKWHKLVFTHAYPFKPLQPLKKAKLELVRHSSREPDYDGLVGSFKHVVDGLTKAGIISDDKMSVIGQPTYSWLYAKPRDGKIVVKVAG